MPFTPINKTRCRPSTHGMSTRSRVQDDRPETEDEPMESTEQQQLASSESCTDVYIAAAFHVRSDIATPTTSNEQCSVCGSFPAFMSREGTTCIWCSTESQRGHKPQSEIEKKLEYDRLGLCAYCGLTADNDDMCSACRLRQKARVMEIRRKRNAECIKQSLCITCRIAIVQLGFLQCTECRAKKAAEKNESRTRTPTTSDGKCSECGGRPTWLSKEGLCLWCTSPSKAICHRSQERTEKAVDYNRRGLCHFCGETTDNNKTHMCSTCRRRKYDRSTEGRRRHFAEHAKHNRCRYCGLAPSLPEKVYCAKCRQKTRARENRDRERRREKAKEDPRNQHLYPLSAVSRRTLYPEMHRMQGESTYPLQTVAGQKSRRKERI
ncbi:hypothetical protein F4808DRAFT_376990 [Astrocystis sublimbata]|nr:hypothetical protein F4808DRAFT_376990 [Astrocystis sublimbata]